MAIDKQLRQMSVPQDPPYSELSHSPLQNHSSAVSTPLAPYATSTPANAFNSPAAPLFTGLDYTNHGSYVYHQTGAPHPVNPMISSQPTPPQATQNVPTAPNITDLFNSLVKAGIVSVPINLESQLSVPVDPAVSPSESSFADEYERKIMTLSISLNTFDITK